MPSEAPPPPSGLKILWLLAAIGTRRILNRMQSQLLGKRATPPQSQPQSSGKITAPRKATARKKKGSGAMSMLFFGAFFLLNGVVISSMLMSRLAQHVEANSSPGGAIPVSENVMGHIANLDQVMHAHVQPKSVRESRLKDARRFLREAFERDPSRQGLRTSARARYAEDMLRVFDTRGSRGFRLSKVPIGGPPFPSTEIWAGRAMLSPIGTLLLLLFLTLTAMALGAYNQDLGKVEWRTEWLFTFPASAQTIFLAQILEIALVNPLIWLACFPFYGTLLYCSGYGWWAPVAALPLAAYTGVLIGATCTVVETALRTRFSLSMVKNCQALFTLSFMVLGFAAGAALAVPWMFDGLVRLSLPLVALYNPVSIPVLICGDEVYSALPLMAFYAIAISLLAVQLAHWMVRDGLMASSGVYAGTRGRKPAAAASEPEGRRWLPHFISGAARKDLQLLLRDRNFLVQTLFVPLLLVGYDLLINSELLEGVLTNYRHAAALAFGLGAYVYMFSAFQVLSVEGQCLWILYTFPRSIERTLMQKAGLWMLFGFLYCGVALAACAFMQPRLGLEAIGDAAMALYGVGVYAFIAAGLGMLATDPLEFQPARKIRPETMFLYMLLAGMYAYGIYADAFWTRLTLLILCTGLACALWQKVRDHAPYLLDPTEEPPPRIALADGLMAALAFFVLQGLLGLLLASTGAVSAPGAQLLIAFAGAGFLVATFSLFGFWRAKVPHLLEQVGLRRGNPPRGSWLGVALWGLGCGLLAAGAAAIYLHVARSFESFRELEHQALKLNAVQGASFHQWILILGVLAAPLFEEFIFRGLIFRGMRRTLPVLLSILLSAGIFAIVHPALSVVPVFVLGAMAALAFERTGLLLAPMLVHGLYNFLVLNYMQ